MKENFKALNNDSKSVRVFKTRTNPVTSDIYLMENLLFEVQYYYYSVSARGLHLSSGPSCSKLG